MTYTEWLLNKAEAYWLSGERLPTDLFADMLYEGIDVETEEQKFNLLNQYN